MATQSQEHETYYYEKAGRHIYSSLNPKYCLDAMQTFEVRQDDVFLITYPKSGTTLMKAMISLIMNNANEDSIRKLGKSAFTPAALHPESHAIEHREPPHVLLEQMECQRFIPTHLTTDLLPPQVFEKKPKVVYIARNPKDIAVSYFHLAQVDPLLYTCKWDEFFKRFLTGRVFCGDWGSHVIPWWERRHNSNVMYLQYEDVVKNLGKVVREMTSFLEQQLTDEQLDRITDMCSFDSMKKEPIIFDKWMCCELWQIDISQSPFVRKGKVGGWKDYFTVAQNEEFDEVYKRWIGDSGIQMTFTSDN
ncbi:sulfotransferase 1B1-like [Glandiceps talaboti]